ncbi:MAG: phage minor capsid protein [Oscillospiraceae bacterium]|nr:phage minor capsid protein [Oscillospiraceae bacterium]
MPPLTPEQLREIPVKLEKLTRNFEDTVLKDISRRIAKAGSVTDTAEWQLIRLKEMGYANDFLEKAIAEYVKKSGEEISRLFFDAAQVSDEFYGSVYAKAGKPFTPLADNPYMQQLIGAGIEQTSGELKNFTRSMGFSLPSPNGKVTFKPIAKAYQDALDLAQMQVSTGVFDYNTAVRNAVKSLTASGLRFVDYASGHVNHADVAVRRAVMTGVSQMSGKISEHNAAELETDLVEVTAYAGARPDHAEWQGRWYSLSGKSKKYPSLVEVTGYGTGAGLKGWNCRHDFYPVLEGISVPAYTEEELRNIDPPPVEYKGETLTYYECTHKQRKMETAIRKTKREIIGAKGSGDEEMFTAKSVLLRRQREEYRAFSQKANLLTQNERSQVYGFDRSIASKSSWAARKKLDNSGRSGIINIGSDASVDVLTRKSKPDNYVEPMPKKQFRAIKKAFQQQGGVIQQNDEIDAYLEKKHAEGITYNAETILLRQNPGRASVFEELIHTAQYRSGKNDGSAKSCLLNEIEAQQKLIKHAKAYKLTELEIKQTENALKRYQEDLEAYIKLHGGD